MKKPSSGFTLIELTAAIAAAAMILLAAHALMMQGMRMQRRTYDIIDNQQSASAFLALAENLVTNGHIALVLPEENGWTIADCANTPLLVYNFESSSVQSGGTDIICGIDHSSVSVSDAHLFCLEFTIGSKTYKTAVYDRTEAIPPT